MKSAEERRQQNKPFEKRINFVYIRARGQKPSSLQISAETFEYLILLLRKNWIHLSRISDSDYLLVSCCSYSLYYRCHTPIITVSPSIQITIYNLFWHLFCITSNTVNIITVTVRLTYWTLLPTIHTKSKINRYKCVCVSVDSLTADYYIVFGVISTIYCKTRNSSLL